MAIANSRISALEDDRVTFSIKNRKKNRKEQISLLAVEFIRRFLLQSLPAGCVRIRNYGFLANRNRSQNLKAIRALMGLPDPAQKPSAFVEEMMQQLTGTDITQCPCCHKGKMQLFVEIPRPVARAPAALAVA